MNLLSSFSNLPNAPLRMPDFQLPRDIQIQEPLSDPNWVERLGQYIISWADGKIDQFVNWFLPTMRDLGSTLLFQGITLFQVAIVALIVFNIFKVMVNFKREDAINQGYIWLIVFVLTVFYQKVCLL